MPVPRTHELTDLQSLLLPPQPELRSLRRGLDFLTRFAVDPRYPGFRAGKSQARAALRWAERVGDACRRLLSSKPRRSARKKSP
jgi:HEPN domain-containing protein